MLGIAITGYLSVPSSLYQDTTGSDVFEYGAAFSKIIGRHNFKAGGMLATNNYNEPVDAASETPSSFQTSNLENPTSSTGSFDRRSSSFISTRIAYGGATKKRFRKRTWRQDNGRVLTGPDKTNAQTHSRGEASV
jgi:hypothetical protein